MKRLSSLWTSVLVVLCLSATAPIAAVNLNSRGEAAAGVGGGVAHVDGRVLASPAGGTSFVTDDVVVYQVCRDRCILETFDLRTGQAQVAAEGGANDVSAGGGVWAAWRAGFGLFTSTGLRLPDAGAARVGPDGSIAYKPQHQSFGPTVLRAPDGTVTTLSEGAPTSIQLLGAGRAVLGFADFNVRAVGLPQPVTLDRAPGIWSPRAVEVAGEWWISYISGARGGIVLHPFGSTRGYVVHEGNNGFGHQVIASGSRITAVYSWTEGEQPGDLRRVEIDTATAPRVELAVTPPPPPPPPPPVLQLQAPNRMSVVAEVLRAHPEINSCDEIARGAIVDYAAKRLNKAEGRLVWGRKSRGKPNGDQAVNPNTDGLTYLRLDGLFEIYDAISGGAPCGATWEGFGPFSQGENGYWAPPQLPAEGGTPPPIDPPSATHRYDGGGNDTGVCDRCQRLRADPIHAIPESKVRHAYDGGEHDTGLCDICGRGRGDALHQENPPPLDPPPATGTLEARVKALETELAKLRKSINDERSGRKAEDLKLQARIDAIAGNGVPADQVKALVDAALQGLFVEGSTGRAFSHVHTLRLEVKR